ncbi:MAG: hypothetical protein LBH25_03690 [Fibromonadaceae bacterium]|jgi:hypothetical protein|nr:hypothetical protein [Fibromonadaceae bacterium]
MDIAKLLSCCLFCAVLAFAQQPSEEKPFDKLRGFAYNPYGTLGAAPTIADILQKPSDIYGHKFVYVNPASNSGYSAFDLAGGSALLGYDRSLILGFAKSFYGLSLSIYPDWICFNNDGHKCTDYYDIGDIGLNFSVPLGSSILYAHAGKTTASSERTGWLAIYKENNEDSIYFRREHHESIIRARLGITGGNALVWNLGLSFYYYDVAVSYLLKWYDAKFLFDFGYKILQSDRVKFIIGLNDELIWQQQLSYEGPNIDYLYVDIFPNFLGEVVLTKHLLAFVGTRYGINFGMELPNGNRYSEMAIRNSGSGAYAGLRYERENWALETRLQGDVFGEVLDGKNPFISLGAFIWL